MSSGIEGLGVKSKTEKEMKSSDFVEILNKDNENMWKQDTKNINNGYPVLSWQ